MCQTLVLKGGRQGIKLSLEITACPIHVYTRFLVYLYHPARSVRILEYKLILSRIPARLLHKLRIFINVILYFIFNKHIFYRCYYVIWSLRCIWRLVGIYSEILYSVTNRILLFSRWNWFFYLQSPHICSHARFLIGCPKKKYLGIQPFL